MQIRHPRSLLTTAIMMAISTTTLAQTKVTIEETLVTAQKREQSVQDIPVAVTAIDAGARNSNLW